MSNSSYKPKFHKKLMMVSPKNGSFDLSFRGGHSTPSNPLEKQPSSTRNSITIEPKVKDNFSTMAGQEAKIYLQEQVPSRHVPTYNGFSGHPAAVTTTAPTTSSTMLAFSNGQFNIPISNSHVQQQNSFQSINYITPQQQMSLQQQQQNQLHEQHQFHLAQVIQQQQQRQKSFHGTQGVESNLIYAHQQQQQQQQQQQHQFQQLQLQQQINLQNGQQSMLGQPNQQYSHALNLMLMQQNQAQQITQGTSINVPVFSTTQTNQPSSFSSRQNSNPNYLYHQQQHQIPQSTKASSSTSKVYMNLSNGQGPQSAKNSTAPQSMLRDFLSKANSISNSNNNSSSQRQQTSHTQQNVLNSQGRQSNNSCNNTITYTNPDLNNIYNPNSNSTSNQKTSSSSKSSRIHSHYFPSTNQSKRSRNPSADKLNDSSFMRLKNVQSPKQRTIRTVMPGSNRDHSQGKSVSRDQSETRNYQADSTQQILSQNPTAYNTISSKSKRNSSGNTSIAAPLQAQKQNTTIAPTYQKKDLTIKTRASIETLKDILQPQGMNSQVTSVKSTQEGEQMKLQQIPFQSFTTSHAQQLQQMQQQQAFMLQQQQQQKRLLQKREELKNKIMNTSVGSGATQPSHVTENTLESSSSNRFSYHKSTNLPNQQQQQHNHQLQSKPLKSKNSSSDQKQMKLLSQTLPLSESLKQTKENNNNIHIEIRVAKSNQLQQQNSQQQQKYSKYPPAPKVSQSKEGNALNLVSDQPQSSSHVSHLASANQIPSKQADSRFDQQSQRVENSTASQTPFCNQNSANEKKSAEDLYTRNSEREEKKDIPLDWSKVHIPITPIEALAKYQRFLTAQEKKEILEFKRIYFLGHNANKTDEAKNVEERPDDEKGDYVINEKDHVAYRYEIVDVLGKGSFGQVLKVFDHKRKEFAALKVIRNKQKFHEQALIELNILHYIKEKDYDNQTSIIKVRDFVVFRDHVCLVFELLSMNLYELLRNNQFQGLTIDLIRRFAIQLLNAISFLKENRIIHCDLKPENILLKQANRSGIKIADFGSSCFDDQVMYTYIQSRFYRAPEVILGIPYGGEIDMWSFGCIIAELFIGYPLFPGEDENEQALYIMELIGSPDPHFIKKCSRRKYFFDESFAPLAIPNSRGKIRVPLSKNWQQVLGCDDENFIDFIKKCLVWEPHLRMTPHDALLHPWILEGLPEDIKTQHIKFLEDKAYENATESQLHKQSCLEAQYSADLQSAAMAQAIEKIYRNTQQNNNTTIKQEKSKTQGVMVTEETIGSVNEELPPPTQTQKVSSLINNFFSTTNNQAAPIDQEPSKINQNSHNPSFSAEQLQLQKQQLFQQQQQHLKQQQQLLQQQIQYQQKLHTQTTNQSSPENKHKNNYFGQQQQPFQQQQQPIQHKKDNLHNNNFNYMQQNSNNPGAFETNHHHYQQQSQNNQQQIHQQQKSNYVFL